MRCLGRRFKASGLVLAPADLGLAVASVPLGLDPSLGLPRSFFTTDKLLLDRLTFSDDPCLEAVEAVDPGLAGLFGWSSADGKVNRAVNVKVDPLPGIAVPSILPP